MLKSPNKPCRDTSRFLWKLVACAVLSGAAYTLPVQSAERASAASELPQPWRADFSGSWEKDYQRSDRWENELTRQMDLLRRSQSQGQVTGSAPVVQYGGGRRGSSMIDLARLAEMISRQNVLEISQTADEVVIEREGDAALICGTREQAMQSFSSAYGSEICGWERQQLIFRITLPEEVEIRHRFSVSDDREWLSALITIARSGTPPFNLIQVYRRFDMPGGGYNCTQTLSRGRVCSTEADNGS